MQRCFCKGYDYAEKVDLSKTYWNLRRKMWVTTHFSEIIKGARNSFFDLGVYLLKSKFRIEDKLRFP